MPRICTTRLQASAKASLEAARAAATAVQAARRGFAREAAVMLQAAARRAAAMRRAAALRAARTVAAARIRPELIGCALGMNVLVGIGVAKYSVDFGIYVYTYFGFGS